MPNTDPYDGESAAPAPAWSQDGVNGRWKRARDSESEDEEDHVHCCISLSSRHASAATFFTSAAQTCKSRKTPLHVQRAGVSAQAT